jgi:hypothetical protein
MTNEQVFFNSGSVQVTVSRLVVGGTTYAMSGITSVWHDDNLSEKSEIYFQIFFGLFLLAIPTILGLLKLLVFSEQHYLMISTASGRSVAYTSSDRETITKIIRAINEALAARQ